MIAMKDLKSRLTALVAAVAIAIGGVGVTATPAAALGKNEREVLGALAGVAALALIIDGVSRNSNASRSRGHDQWDNRRDGRWNSKNNRDNRLVPAECVTQIRVDRRSRDVVAERCLRREGFDRRLPEACAFDIRTDSGRRTVYGLNCLRDKGYRLARYN